MKKLLLAVATAAVSFSAVYAGYTLMCAVGWRFETTIVNTTRDLLDAFEADWRTANRRQ